VRIISRYLVAFVAAHGLWITISDPLVFQYPNYTTDWRGLAELARQLQNFCGLFNFMAMWLHIRDMARGVCSSSPRARFLNPQSAEMVEFSRVDYARLCRRNKADVAKVQNANQTRWRELGLTYEQGLSGQLEPLSEEERASHFYSIMGAGDASKLQQARVV
jgi:hypothetical protein